MIKPHNQVECWITEPDPSNVVSICKLTKDEVICWLNVVCWVSELDCDWDWLVDVVLVITESLLAVVVVDGDEVEVADGALPPPLLLVCCSMTLVDSAVVVIVVVSSALEEMIGDEASTEPVVAMVAFSISVEVEAAVEVVNSEFSSILDFTWVDGDS